MPSFFTRSKTKASASPEGTSRVDTFGRKIPYVKDGVRKECIGGPVILLYDAALRESTTRPTSHEEPLRRIPTCDGPPVVDRFVDYNRYSFAATRFPLTEDGGEGYGYMAVQTGLVLGLEDLKGVIGDVTKQLEERGLATPLLFSSQAVDLSSTKTRLFIQSYIASLRPFTSNKAPLVGTYKNNLRLCSPHELAWLLRWAMARVVRIVREEKVVFRDEKGKAKRRVVEVQEREVRGLVDWTEYEIWRGKERAKGYPARAIELFFLGLPPDLSDILRTLLNLLSRLISHSNVSGLTPPHLASLFGPLIFGLAAPRNSHDLTTGIGTFSETHSAYVRASAGMEHLLLAFVRGQESSHQRLTGDFPRSLGAWVRGYPGGVVDDQTLSAGVGRKGERLVQVFRMGRNVRSYSGDLMRTHVEWVGEFEVQQGRGWDAWRGVVWDGRVEVTERHGRRLGLKAGASFARETSSRRGTTATPSQRGEEGPATDWKHGEPGDGWGMFEDSGFAQGDDGFKDKLRFDLSEGAKQQVNSKRMTMTWADFASPSGGFDRTASALDESLALAQPLLQEHLAHWPEEREEMRKQLVKGHKELPSFETYDHAIRVNDGEEWVEEAFLDVWADVVLGCGWMEAGELTYRKANWVILEYQKVDPNSNPNASVFVFEEFVPLKYQDDLVHQKPKKHGLFKHFSRHSEPPTSSRAVHSRQEAEFDARLRKRQSTKVITLSKPINVSEIGSPLPSSPQTPRSGRDRSRGSQDTLLSPQSRSMWDGSPMARNGMEQHSSPSFLDRLNMAVPKVGSPPQAIGEGKKTETRVMMVRTSTPRFPLDGQDPSKLQFGDAEKWIDILASNGARAMHTAAPVVSSVPRQTGRFEGSGFRVLSRSVSALPQKLGTFAAAGTTEKIQPDTPLGMASDLTSLAPSSPSTPMTYYVATKASSCLSPGSHDSRTELLQQTPQDVDIVHRSRFRAVGRTREEPEYVLESPITVRSVECTDPRADMAGYDVRDNFAYTVGSAYSSDERVPIALGKPLPIPSRYHYSSSQRDTLFSVIDGYARRGSGTDGPVIRHDLTDHMPARPRDEPSISVDENEGPWTCSPQRVSSYSVYSNAEPDITFDSLDPENSSPTLDPEGYHSDETVLDLLPDESELYREEETLEPPPKLTDIEAIARQPSPGRYGHGVLLDFVDEESEDE